MIGAKAHKLIQAMALAAVLLLCGACVSGPGGGPGDPRPVNPSRFVPELKIPAEIHAGCDADWTVSWDAQFDPVQIRWDFSSGAQPRTISSYSADGGSSTVTVRMNGELAESQTFTATVWVTNSEGATLPDNGFYTVEVFPNNVPQIGSITFDEIAGTLLVTVFDEDPNEALTVSALNLPDEEGETREATVETVEGDDSCGDTAGSVIFDVPAEWLLSGDFYVVDFTVSDGTDTSEISNILIGEVDGGGDGGGGGGDEFELEADTLYAIAGSAEAGIATANGNQNVEGDTVLVVVATGAPANPLQYINAIGITVQGGTQGALQQYDISQGAVYVADSFNLGAPGGAANEPDGVWADMEGAIFTLPDDGSIRATDIGDGRIRIDFSFGPDAGSGSDIQTAGELFNFEMAFGKAGTYDLGFQEFESVNRTYYSGDSEAEFFWGDISNDIEENNVTVIESSS